MNTALLRCTNLEVGYTKPVLTGIDLNFGTGQFISLLGPNGAGKTTLLRTLSRHIKPLKGQAFIADRPIDNYPALALARIMAVVLTEKHAPPLLSVLEYVALGRYPHTGFMGRLREQDLEVVTASLIAVKADELAGRQVEQLSDGEKQKVVLARALAQEPQIMLLDEPTAHLDLKHRVEVMTILRSLCRTQNLTVLAALHDVDVASKVSDQVILVKDGRLEGFGRPEDLLTSEVVAHLYDFSDAGFSHELGGIEIRGDGRCGRAFVLSGSRDSTAIYRLLSKHGFAITTGFLRQKDLDTHVARALKADVLFSEDHLELSPQDLVALDRCDYLIDCGPADSGLMDMNQALIQEALNRKLPVFSLGDREQTTPGCLECKSLPDLIEILDNHKKQN